MCRSIKQLRYPDRPPTDEEIRAAALQFVRKVSGYRTPSRANEAVFNAAVAEVGDAVRRLFDEMPRRGSMGSAISDVPPPDPVPA